MAKINIPIIGNNKKNKLINIYNSGFTYMSGKKGNDTYIINNISQTATEIEDTKGRDALILNNIKGNALVFLFDVMVNEDFSENILPDDGLYIIKSNMLTDVVNQLGKFMRNPNDYNNLPQNGITEILYYFGDTNNIQSNGKYGKKMGTGYIENIYTDSKGVRYAFDLKSYVNEVRPKVLKLLKKYGYNSTNELLVSKNKKIKNKVLKIYQNSAVKYTITGNKNANSITGGNGDDIIKAGKGNDKINAGLGNNLIYFAKNDGKDTVLNGNGNDTLVFSNEKLNRIKGKYSGNHVVISYTGGKITLKNYKKGNHSAQYFKVGNTTKAVDDLLPYNNVKFDGIEYKGTQVKDYVNSNQNLATVKTFAGNDKIIISGMANEIYAGKGNDYIQDTGMCNIFYFNAGDGNDTLKLSPENIFDGQTFIFNDEKNITELKYTKISDDKHKITYNGGKDSLSVTGKISDTNIKVGNDFYNIYQNQFRKIYSSHIYVGFDEITTQYNKDYDVFQSSNSNDYISDINATTIKALGGDDYINFAGGYIYGGKGNDTITSTGSNLMFNSGDGNDIVNDSNSENIYEFLDENDISNIAINNTENGLKIGYNNNKDFVNIQTDTDIEEAPSGYIKVQDNIYSILGTSLRYAEHMNIENLSGIIGTNQDDNIESFFDDIKGKNVILNSGNDNFELLNTGIEKLFTFINIESNGSINDKTLYVGDKYNFVAFKDYFSKSGTTVIKNSSYLKQLNNLDMEDSVIESLKTDVSGWLTSDGRNYGSVMDALSDNANRDANFTALMSNSYFGKIQWQDM